MRTKPKLRRKLALAFLKIGATTYGGWSGALSAIEEDLVKKQKLITEAELAEAVTYSQLLPGSAAVTLVGSLTYKASGIIGSIVSVVAYLLPALVIMTLLSALYFKYSSISTGNAMNGVLAALIGVLLATFIKLVTVFDRSVLTWVLTLGAFAGAVFGINQTVIVLLAGLAGILGLRDAVPVKHQPKHSHE